MSLITPLTDAVGSHSLTSYASIYTQTILTKTIFTADSLYKILAILILSLKPIYNQTDDT